MARLIRPVLPTYSGVNAHSRDAGRRISDLHDAHAATETLDDHVRPAAEADGALDGDRLDGVRAALVERRDALAAERDLEARLVDVRADLVEERERVDGPPVPTEGYDAVGGGLRIVLQAGPRVGEAYDDPSSSGSTSGASG